MPVTLLPATEFPEVDKQNIISILYPKKEKWKIRIPSIFYCQWQSKAPVSRCNQFQSKLIPHQTKGGQKKTPCSKLLFFKIHRNQTGHQEIPRIKHKTTQPPKILKRGEEYLQQKEQSGFSLPTSWTSGRRFGRKIIGIIIFVSWIKVEG